VSLKKAAADASDAASIASSITLLDLSFLFVSSERITSSQARAFVLITNEELMRQRSLVGYLLMSNRRQLVRKSSKKKKCYRLQDRCFVWLPIEIVLL